MIRRTTIDLDLDLLAAAKASLGCSTARETIHEALRRALDEGGHARRAARASYLDLLDGWIDADVLASDAAWR